MSDKLNSRQRRAQEALLHQQAREEKAAARAARLARKKEVPTTRSLDAVDNLMYATALVGSQILSVITPIAKSKGRY